jgi:glycosyltransferase involved in cell wall biosynthesis
MRKIKILRIIARLNIGGPAIHAILLTEGLNKSKFDSLLVCGSIGRDEGDMSYYVVEKNVKPIFIPELKRQLHFFKDIAAFKKIYNIIKTVQPDIIHTHTAKAGTLGRLAGIFYNCLNLFARKRIRLIHTFHGHIFEGYFSTIQTKVFILIERFLAIFTSKIITVSDSVKKELIALGICPEEKIEVIPLGLELEKFFMVQESIKHFPIPLRKSLKVIADHAYGGSRQRREGDFLELPFRDNTVLNIGIIGRLIPIKNHRLFLETAAKVIADNPGIQLRFKIIGDGELRKDLEEYAHRLGIDRYVDFLGWQKDLVNVYSNLDIVALTSKNEGAPVSLIEAMASGRAVVATDVGGVKDLLGKEINDVEKPKKNFKLLERGLLVKSRDSIGFTDALNFLLQNNTLRKNMGMCARDFVKVRFTKERLIRDIETLYDGLSGLN